MEPNKQPGNHQDHQQGTINLPESLPSSETSFGSFVGPETDHEGASGCATSFPTDNINLLPPDEGLCATNMLNLEIVAHSHTELALHLASTKASRLERHYTYQSIALTAWQNAYQGCLDKNLSQAEEIAGLKQEVRELKAENQQLLEQVQFWRDTTRPASA